jgi:hypothetical protein
MLGEQHHPVTGMTLRVKGRGSNAGNLVYRDMFDEDGRVIGVRIDSNDDPGFWLEFSYPNDVNESDESKKANEEKEEESNKKRNRDGDELQSKEEDEDEGEDEEDDCEVSEYERLRNGDKVDARELGLTDESGWKLVI